MASHLNTSAFYDNKACKSVAKTLDGFKKPVMPLTFVADINTNNARHEDITQIAGNPCTMP